jgi:hypothetical protein
VTFDATFFEKNECTEFSRRERIECCFHVPVRKPSVKSFVKDCASSFWPHELIFTDAQIAEFCSTNYKVSFPMFSKISVKGSDQHPLYNWLTSTDPEGGEIKWNFHKFLIGPDGQKIKNIPPTTEPAALRELILQHLK